MSADSQQESRGFVPLADPQPRPAKPRPLRMAPRPMPAHPGRGLAAEPGWLYGDGEYSAEVVEKAAQMSVLRPDSLTVFVDIVNKCNLRCIMCHFSFDEVFYQRAELMSPETFAALVKAVRPYTRRLSLSCAYEPTASPHFAEILRLAGEQGFAEISFITNGNLLNDRLLQAIADAGVTEVCVSVHAARSETYAHILRGGVLDRAVENVQKLLALRRERQSALPRIQFNVALMRSNAQELVEIIELAARLGVDAVAFRHLIVFEGLDMETESLAGHDRHAANRCIRAALLRAQELGVTLTNAADYFDVDGFEASRQCVEMPPALVSPPEAPSLPSRRSLAARLRGWLAPPAPLPSPPQRAPAVILGNVDMPAGDLSFYGETTEISGWALTDDGLLEVALSRDPLPGEAPALLNADGHVPLGLATFHNATRGDVMRAHADKPYAYRAGWSFTLRRRDLPAQGLDGLAVHVIAKARSEERLLIGQRRIRAASSDACHVRCHKPFDSLYIDARAQVYPYPDCHADQPFGAFEGQPFEAIWHDPRLTALRLDMVADNAPGMCVRCPLFINRDVDQAQMFAPHADFSTEAIR